MTQHATLSILDGPLRGHVLKITRRDITLGRDTGCDVALAEYTRVSRRHARLAWDGQQFTVTDLGSTNGVLVDGQPVKSGPMRVGSRLQMGDFAAQLWLPHGAPAFLDAPLPDPTSLPTPRLEPPQPGAASTCDAAPPSHRIRKRSWCWPVATGTIALGLMIGLLINSRRSVVPAAPRPAAMPSPIQAATEAAPVAQAQPQATGAVPTAIPVAPLAPVVAAAPAASGAKIGADAVRNGKAATVLIAHAEGNALSTGSGFVTGDGRRVVTNRHVVVDGSGRPTECLLIFHSGSAQQIKVEVQPGQIQLAPNSADDNQFTDDLAIITLDSPVVAPLPLGRAEDLIETDTVYALGFPLGISTLTLDNQLPSVSVKAVSVERLQSGQVGAEQATNVIQLGGTITHGNSGGPVLNARGEVVGVVSMGAQGTGMSFAIPSVFVKALM